MVPLIMHLLVHVSLQESERNMIFEVCMDNPHVEVVTHCHYNN